MVRQRKTEDRDRDRDREAGGQMEKDRDRQADKERNSGLPVSKILDHCICEFQNHFYSSRNPWLWQRRSGLF